MRLLIESEDVDFMVNFINTLSKNCQNINIYNVLNNSNNILKELDCISLNYKNITKKTNDLKSKIIKELTYLGYDISYKGTQYLIKAIEYIVYNPNKNLSNLEKEVYPELIRINNDSIHNIKCNINRANTMMYAVCEIEKLKDYFGFTCDMKPKTKTVISTIIDKIS